MTKTVASAHTPTHTPDDTKPNADGYNAHTAEGGKPDDAVDDKKAQTSDKKSWFSGGGALGTAGTVLAAGGTVLGAGGNAARITEALGLGANATNNAITPTGTAADPFNQLAATFSGIINGTADNPQQQNISPLSNMPFANLLGGGEPVQPSISPNGLPTVPTSNANQLGGGNLSGMPMGGAMNMIGM